jgi:hypothetical protein
MPEKPDRIGQIPTGDDFEQYQGQIKRPCRFAAI